MEFKIHFSARAHTYTKEEEDAVLEAMRNANPLTQGQNLHEFEAKLCRYIGGRHAFGVCNATAALELAAQLCCFDKGDEVVIPSHTFTSSAYPFAKSGARIVWADIDPHKRVVTAQTIADKVTSKTKAVVVAHLYGYGADMAEIMEMAKRHNFLVIEDAAQALGVEVEGKMAGAYGDFGVLSFHSHKNISTLGEGGALMVRDKELAALVPGLRHNGHCSFLAKRNDYWIPAMGNVDFPQINGRVFWPNNYCIGEVECALGLKLLDRINVINQKKRERAIRFIDALADFPELEFHRVPSSRHNYHLLAAKLTNGKRDEFIRRMAGDKKIQCVVQYYPLNRYPLYQTAGFGDADCPNADNFFDNMVSFPFHHSLLDSDLDYILQSTQDVLKELRA
ncbi:MAG: DegT/DnrJ/EryC1/StrS family aminotransferase [Nitrospina sp.]|jgi:perosamine synthetase|nr:DegT/DnrJ/EryC1/StrS family aminotransferase [Nitrospina sp.]MBT3413585.1 DegT/DnrJ/EryC1/StrS family aminotransferase [Nitrospina sp.]MBT3857880.1 DegT/DnrJ/EryC1/StrS family aminotransferase [Nitrospina sp.]MBT4104872.1 DegT/DnrJ/EryC1/StrS family aminotransferase [Nitrospina sp.]MBT4390886.1 DegT/DnrJ/EryC1/StrS family aminotransferase [Nitrospina sp.]